MRALVLERLPEHMELLWVEQVEVRASGVWEGDMRLFFRFRSEQGQEDLYPAIWQGFLGSVWELGCENPVLVAIF